MGNGGTRMTTVEPGRIDTGFVGGLCPSRALKRRLVPWRPGTTAPPNHTIGESKDSAYGTTKVQVSDGPEDGPVTALMGPPLKVDWSTSPVATFSHPVPS
jgi:hypothetical protein